MTDGRVEPVRTIDADAVEPFARGCAILGTGGGGDVHTGALMLQQAIGDYGPVDVVTLDELPDDGLVLPLGMIGAPTVAAEKIANGNEGERLRAHLERLTGRHAVAVMSSEIGGSNGLIPAAWATRMDLPLLDADTMGRAFPEVQMVTPHVAGRTPDLIALADERGSIVTVQAVSGEWAEAASRAVTVAFGGHAAMADYVMTVAEERGCIVEGSVSRAIAIGRAVMDAVDPVAELIRTVEAHLLLVGRVVDVERRTTGGFARGTVLVDGTGDDVGRTLRLEIQNENLVAYEDDAVRASVPDLISVIDTVTADAIGTESLRYGQRVAVIAFACDPIWRTPRGLETAGPRAFGYDFDYVPIEALRAG